MAEDTKQPVRATAIVNFLGRECMMYEPAETQKAVFAQIARSTRVDAMTKIARVVDLMESWFVHEDDRAWFADKLMDGVWDFESDVLGQLNVIFDAFTPEATNRAGRRAPTKRAARKAAPR